MQEYYYKATLANKMSHYDRLFSYREGLNIHPDPNKHNHPVCSEGFHLAKTLKAARNYVPGATEFYLARAGVILAEDDDKIRCSYIWLGRLLSREEVREIDRVEMSVKEREQRMRAVGSPSALLCGQDWLDKHAFDITQVDINALRLEVKTDRHKFSIGLNTKAKDRKYLLKQAIRVGAS